MPDPVTNSKKRKERASRRGSPSREGYSRAESSAAAEHRSQSSRADEPRPSEATESANVRNVGSQEPVNLLKKISDIEADMQKIVVSQRKINKDIIALKALVEAHASAKIVPQSESQAANSQPDSKQQEGKGPSVQVPTDPRVSIMSLTETRLTNYFNRYGNEDRHRKNAAGLVTSFLDARGRNPISNQLAIFLEPVPRMLQDEKTASVWSKVIDLWLADCDTHRGSGFDKLLDACVVDAVKKIIDATPVTREWSMQGDGDALRLFFMSVGGYRTEMARRKETSG
ncbi:MAG: hypothetical protein Q9209_003484 [Squamulea sp. 1 TL-2023]